MLIFNSTDFSTNVFDWMIFSTVKKSGKFKTEFVTILNFALDCNEMKGRKVKSGWHSNKCSYNRKRKMKKWKYHHNSPYVWFKYDRICTPSSPLSFGCKTTLPIFTLVLLSVEWKERMYKWSINLISKKISFCKLVKQVLFQKVQKTHTRDF